MKKLICLLLALVMLLSLAACKPPVDGPDMENPDATSDVPVTPPGRESHRRPGGPRRSGRPGEI